uniref:Putative secreted protein n=1 Tax=Ornithodoros turicata TaxID=34597 RepID=A0A2R5LBX3_9ACAR
MKALVVILLLALATELFNPVSAAKKKSNSHRIPVCVKIPCNNMGMCSPSCAGCYGDGRGSPSGIKYCQAG